MKILVATIATLACLALLIALSLGDVEQPHAIDVIRPSSAAPTSSRAPLESSGKDAIRRPLEQEARSADRLIVAGRIVDSSMMPLGDAIVGDLMSAIPETTTDDDGRFSVTITKYVSMLRENGIIIDVEAPSGDRAAAHIDPQSAGDVLIIVEPCGAISGHLEGEYGLTTPITARYKPEYNSMDCCSSLARTLGAANGHLALAAAYSAAIDADGHFTITGLPGSKGVIEIDVDGIGSAALDVAVTCGQVLEIGGIKLSPYITLSGRVLGTSRKGIAEANVRLYSSPSRQIVAAVDTDTNGHFSFSGIRSAETLTLEASAPGHSTATISMGGRKSIPDIQVTMPTGASVYFRSAQVSPSAWRAAVIEPRGGGSPRVDLRDNGFVVDGLLGNVTVSVEVPGFAPQVFSERDLGLSESRFSDIQLVPLSEVLAGAVATASGKPLKGAKITCVADAPPSIRGLRCETTSDDTGTFHIPALARGRWNVTISAASYATHSVAIEIPAPPYSACLDGVGIAKASIARDDMWPSDRSIYVGYQAHNLFHQCHVTVRTEDVTAQPITTTIGADPLVVNDLIPGDYRFATFGQREHAAAFARREITTDRATSARITAGEATSIVLATPEVASITGTVIVGGQHQGDSIVTLLVLSPTDAVLSSEYQVATSGKFAFDVPLEPEQGYVLAISHALLWAPTFKRIPPPMPGQTVVFDFVIGSHRVNVSTFEASSGAPIGNVPFRAHQTTPTASAVPDPWRKVVRNASQAWTTDDSGTATVYIEEDGHYSFYVNSSEWESQSGQGELSLTQNSGGTVAIPLHQRALVYGRVSPPPELGAEEFDRLALVVEAMVHERGMVGWDAVSYDDPSFRIPCERGGEFVIRLRSRVDDSILDSISTTLGPNDEKYIVFTW